MRAFIYIHTDQLSGMTGERMSEAKWTPPAPDGTRQFEIIIDASKVPDRAAMKALLDGYLTRASDELLDLLTPGAAP